MKVRRLICLGSVVGGPDTEEEDMVIYVGEGMNGIYNQPYFDNSMKTNFTVQVRICNKKKKSFDDIFPTNIQKSNS